MTLFKNRKSFNSRVPVADSSTDGEENSQQRKKVVNKATHKIILRNQVQNNFEGNI